MKNILITGGSGFIGKNLVLSLNECKKYNVKCLNRDEITSITNHLNGVDVVFHLAGVNRTDKEDEFINGNYEFTKIIINAVNSEVINSKKNIKFIYTSSTHAALDTPYGRSKAETEKLLINECNSENISLHIYRLPNVFGKWSLPNYNSVVATFCFNIAHDIPIEIRNGDLKLKLVYIDDLLDNFKEIVEESNNRKVDVYNSVKKSYEITVGDLAIKIRNFHKLRKSLTVSNVGDGLNRALYATYISFLPESSFSYELPIHEDKRGKFVEIIKTVDSGQFSYFSAAPGVIRGGHYHHTKTEKFFVVKGFARFRFKNIFTNRLVEIVVNGENPRIVESIPGWIHDIQNIGNDELLVMLWANEIYDRTKSDTFSNII